MALYEIQMAYRWFQYKGGVFIKLNDWSINLDLCHNDNNAISLLVELNPFNFPVLVSHENCLFCAIG